MGTKLVLLPTRGQIESKLLESIESTAVTQHPTMSAIVSKASMQYVPSKSFFPTSIEYRIYVHFSEPLFRQVAAPCTSDILSRPAIATSRKSFRRLSLFSHVVQTNQPSTSDPQCHAIHLPTSSRVAPSSKHQNISPTHLLSVTSLASANCSELPITVCGCQPLGVGSTYFASEWNRPPMGIASLDHRHLLILFIMLHRSLTLRSK